MRLLVTRPQPDASRTAEALRARGHDVLVAPLLRIEPVAGAAIPPGPFDAMALTSANAVANLACRPDAAALTALPLFAVGPRTAQAAQAAGFADVVAAAGDGASLAVLIAARLPSGARLLYPAAEQRAVDLAAALAPHGIAVETVAVYRAVPATAFPPEAKAALERGTVDGVLHYSRRSAMAYLRCSRNLARVLSPGNHVSNDPSLRPIHFCLSAQVADILAAERFHAVVAARPEEAALFDCIGG